jgi:hypothetical protein
MKRVVVLAIFSGKNIPGLDAVNGGSGLAIADSLTKAGKQPLGSAFQCNSSGSPRRLPT